MGSSKGRRGRNASWTMTERTAARFHSARVAGAVYWFVAAGQADAEAILRDVCADEIEDNEPIWSTLTNDEADRINVRDRDGLRCALTACESGDWFCSEYD